MSVAELLSKLEAKTQDLSYVSPAWEKLTPADIAHALGKISKEAALFARLIHLRQEAYRNGLLDHLVKFLTKRAKIDRWKVQDRQRVQNIADAAITLYRGHRCPQCNGVGELTVPLKVKCGQCSGSGWRLITVHEIAQFIGVNDEAYTKTWRHRLGIARDELAALDKEFSYEIRKAIFWE